MNKTVLMSFGVAGVIIAVAGYSMFAVPEQDVNTTTESATSSGVVPTNLPTVDAETQTGSSNTIRVQAPTPPDLSNIIINESTLSAEAREILRAKLQAITETLKKDPKQIDLWLDLGVLRRAGGDFSGARDAWLYVVAIAPADPRAYGNLGVLYAENLRDNAAAEKYFTDALARGTHLAYLYTQVYEFYLYNMKDERKAIMILDSAIKNISAPDNEVFLFERAKYK